MAGVNSYSVLDLNATSADHGFSRCAARVVIGLPLPQNG
jgi:hypothetical protein